MQHHNGITDFATALMAEAAHSPDYEVLDLLPTSRSTIGYWHSWTNYVLHPDASFTLDYKGRWVSCLLEFERRATTPKRIPARLESYRRYFVSGWAERDHGGKLPMVLFVFETRHDENTFLRVVPKLESAPIFTTNVQTLDERGVLGQSWQMPPRHTSTRLTLKSLTATGVPLTPSQGLPIGGPPAKLDRTSIPCLTPPWGIGGRCCRNCWP